MDSQPLSAAFQSQQHIDNCSYVSTTQQALCRKDLYYVPNAEMHCFYY